MGSGDIRDHRLSLVPYQWWKSDLGRCEPTDLSERVRLAPSSNSLEVWCEGGAIGKGVSEERAVPV